MLPSIKPTEIAGRADMPSVITSDRLSIAGSEAVPSEPRYVRNAQVAFAPTFCANHSISNLDLDAINMPAGITSDPTPPAGVNSPEVAPVTVLSGEASVPHCDASTADPFSGTQPAVVASKKEPPVPPTFDTRTTVPGVSVVDSGNVARVYENMLALPGERINCLLRA